MVKAAPPSGNPAGGTDLAGVLAFALKKYGQRTDDMLPAKVLSYDRATNVAKVLPVIPGVTTANEVVQKAIVASVPVLQLGCGFGLLSFPLEAGDLGWIKANDRDISQFKKTYSNASGPPTQRTHSFEDAMFIPDNMMRGVTLADDGICLQNAAGTAAVIITLDGEVKIISAEKITFTSPEIFFDSTNCNMGGVRFNTHHHTGVQTGGGQTGGPVNP